MQACLQQLAGARIYICSNHNLTQGPPCPSTSPPTGFVQVEHAALVHAGVDADLACGVGQGRWACHALGGQQGRGGSLAAASTADAKQVQAAGCMLSRPQRVPPETLMHQSMHPRDSARVSASPWAGKCPTHPTRCTWQPPTECRTPRKPPAGRRAGSRARRLHRGRSAQGPQVQGTDEQSKDQIDSSPWPLLTAAAAPPERRPKCTLLIWPAASAQRCHPPAALSKLSVKASESMVRLCRCTPRLVGIFLRAGTSVLGAAGSAAAAAQYSRRAHRGLPLDRERRVSSLQRPSLMRGALTRLALELDGHRVGHLVSHAKLAQPEGGG